MNIRSRRMLGIGAIGLAVAIVFASAASACVAFKGKMTITDAADSSDTKTYIGDGLHMNYCGTPTGTPSPLRLNGTSSAGFTVSVATQSTGDLACRKKLQNTTYYISYHGPTSNTNPSDSATDCFNGPLGNGTTQTTMSVDSTGAGTKLVTASNLSGDYKLCVSHITAASQDGNMGFINVI